MLLPSLVSEVAESLLCALPEEFDQRIRDVMYQVASATRDQGVFLVHFQGENGRSLFLECRDNDSHGREPTELSLPHMTFSTWLPRVYALEPIYIEDTAKQHIHSKPTQRFLRQNQFKSLLIVPLNCRGFAVGFFGLATRERTKVWDEPVLNELMRLGGVLGNVFDRDHMERHFGRLIRSRRETRRREVEVQEQERRYLARELHDQIGQLLTAIKTEAALIAGKRGVEEPILKHAQAIQEQVNQIYDSIHDLISRLRSTVLDQLGLEGAVRSYLMDSTAAKLGIRYDVEVRGDLEGVEDAIEMTLFRIFQECITNVARHSRAKNVSVIVERGCVPIEDRRTRYRGVDGEQRKEVLRQDFVRLVVRDDGCGFDAENVAPGMGIMGMAERIQAIGGHLDVKSEPGFGTTITSMVNLAVIVETEIQRGAVNEQHG